MRLAVIGHIEWVTFARVASMPAAGEIVQASEVSEQLAGGGGVAAVALKEMAGASTFFTVLGDDVLGYQSGALLREAGVEVRAVHRGSTRRAFTHLDGDGERTITVLGPRHEPRGDDPLGWADLSDFDAVYIAAADAEAVVRARAARIVVATARILPALRDAGVAIDALVGSANDLSERYVSGDLSVEPSMVVRTEGRAGGTITTSAGTSRYEAAPEPAEISDSYGCGDRFVTGITYALASNHPDPTAFAATVAAEALTRRGAGT